MKRRWVVPLALAAPLLATDAPAAPASLVTTWTLDAPAETPAPKTGGPLVIADPLLAAFGFDRFATPELERPSESGFFRGRFGARSWRLVPDLALERPAAQPDGSADEPSPLDAAPTLAVPGGTKKCKKRAITFVRYGAEQDTFSLAACDGAILPDVLDRLSAITRPPAAERPTVPFPDEPSPEATSGEWVPGIRMIHPRLVWALERVAEAFPRRTFYVMSGYRPGHGGPHASARAIDLFLMNVANERVYKFCRTLPDVGCGYYPNNKFVHIDVRKPGTGKAYWIDTSAPGEPSEYVDAWPGVEKGGGAVFLRGEGRQ